MSILSKSPTEKNYSNAVLLLVLLFTLVTRLLQLDFQSPWVDELDSIIQSSPQVKWEDMYHDLKCCPPLHPTVLKILFSTFGHTTFMARLPSVMAGTLAVWAIYLLGKEFRNRQLGLMAAILTAVNYFHLYYSQEARSYMFAFLFVILSFLFFIRLLKSLSIKNSILYSAFTLLLLYSHYYGLFVLASQLVLLVVFYRTEDITLRRVFIMRFGICGLIIGLGYWPWVSGFLELTTIRSFWIKTPHPFFFIDYFFDYFGNSAWIKFPAMALLLFLVYKTLYRRKVNFLALQKRPNAFAFVVLVGWTFITLLIPYIRSLTSVPMLHQRYTIVILPAILVALAYSIESISKPKIRIIVLWIFVLLSIFDIAVRQRYYTKITKTQFRELVQYLVKNNTENYAMINELYGYQQYYFNLYHARPTILPGARKPIIDSILRGKSPAWQLKGFWIVGAFHEQPLSEVERKDLDTAYVLVKERQFFDAWAQLYIRRQLE